MQLTIHHLKVKAGNQMVVNDVSLIIKPHELHVLMGPNGSGKSSLAKAIMGHPDYHVISGTVKLGRRDLLKLTPDQRARAGLFLGFQHPSPLPGVSLFQLLKVCLNGKSSLNLYHHLSSQAKILKLPPRLLEAPLNENFSGGEQKKAEILQFTHLKPQFAILDEPDTGLDIDSLQLLAAKVQTALRAGTGILLITHLPRLLHYLKPTAVHIIKQGKLVKTGKSPLVQQIERSGYAAIH